MTHTHTFPWRRIVLLAAVSVLLELVPAVAIAASSAPVQSCPLDTQNCNGKCIPASDLCLLAGTPGGIMSIPANMVANLGAFFLYVNEGFWSWAFATVIGIAILNGVFGAFQIAASNGNQGSVDAGKARILWSIAGVLILLLAGTILHFINPVGFTPA